MLSTRVRATRASLDTCRCCVQEPDSLSVTLKVKSQNRKVILIGVISYLKTKKTKNNASFEVFLFSLKPDGQGFEMLSSFQQ